MKSLLLLATLVIAVVFISGCTESQTAATVYICPDERTVNDPSLCSATTSTTIPATTTTSTTTPRVGIYFKGESSLIPAGISGSYYIVGELLNNGTRSYNEYQISIVADLYKGEKLVDTTTGFLTANLPAGGTTSFKIIVFNAPDFDNYNLKASA